VQLFMDFWCHFSRHTHWIFRLVMGYYLRRSRVQLLGLLFCLLLVSLRV